MLTRRFVLTGCAACAALATTRIGDAAEANEIKEISGPGYVMRFIGGMRAVIMSGRRDAVLDVRTLKGRPHLYGLGPIEGLTGEVTVINNRPSLARVGMDHRAHVTESYDVGVPFFVWAEVPSWQRTPIPPAVSTYAELEKFIGETTANTPMAGRAFPFIVSGQLNRINYHVVNAAPDTPAGMEGHQQMQVSFELLKSTVTLVGFWSNQHQGIFTPMGSNMHVHFQTDDNSASGHAQALELLPHGMDLSLPG